MRASAGRRILVTGGSGFIGTALTRLLSDMGAEVYNVDIARPSMPWGRGGWRPVDIMDRVALGQVLHQVDPQVVVHLAARTDTLARCVDDYGVNHIGTDVLMDAIRDSACEQFVATSTQYVIGPGKPYVDIREYAPHTAYGQSKVLMEQRIEGNPPTENWTIVRPTNVWGPGHTRYAGQFWRVLDRGIYFHPKGVNPIRSYGYIGSVCSQIASFVMNPPAFNQAILYVGDSPIPQDKWVDGFAVAFNGRPARRVPAFLLSSLANVGDQFEKTGRPAPLNTGRLASMITEYGTPMQATFNAVGREPTLTLEAAIMETMGWLRFGLEPQFSRWLPENATSTTFAPEGSS